MSSVLDKELKNMKYLLKQKPMHKDLCDVVVSKFGI